MKKEKREIIIILVLSFIAFAFAFAFGRSESKLIKCREQVKGQQEKINQLKNPQPYYDIDEGKVKCD